jgi:hypothetical protein
LILLLIFLVLSETPPAPSWGVVIVGVLGGGVAGAIATAASKAFLGSKRADVKARELDATADHEEREITRDFAIEERSDRRRMEQEIRGLREELRLASVQVAKLEAKYEESEDSRNSLLEIVATLRTHGDLQTQLIERQRKQIDDLVRRLMSGMEHE